MEVLCFVMHLGSESMGQRLTVGWCSADAVVEAKDSTATGLELARVRVEFLSLPFRPKSSIIAGRFFLGARIQPSALLCALFWGDCSCVAWSKGARGRASYGNAGFMCVGHAVSRSACTIFSPPCRHRAQAFLVESSRPVGNNCDARDFSVPLVRPASDLGYQRANNGASCQCSGAQLRVVRLFAWATLLCRSHVPSLFSKFFSHHY